VKLHRLYLQNFRNYREQTFPLSPKQTILLGDNAQGKSNVLEAIFLLSTLKTYREGRDRDLIRFGANCAQITGYGDQLELQVILRSGSRRTLAINGVSQTKNTDFLGYLPVVLFSSLDLALIRTSPETRRAWLDHTLMQLEPIYSNLSHEYQQVLRQKNALLKHCRTQAQSLPPAEMAVWNHQLAQLGTKIMRRRWRLIHRLQPLAQQWQRRISAGQESLDIIYAPKLECANWDDPAEIHTALLTAMADKQSIELWQGTSLVGPHRDEVQFHLNHVPARTYGSQGQQRTLILALKLAELELLELVLQKTPLLLLDDVLAELDLHRQQQLLGVINDRVQTIITTTHLDNFDRAWQNQAQILRIHQGSIVP
jgi:DNA replication and repair protein RecF